MIGDSTLAPLFVAFLTASSVLNCLRAFCSLVSSSFWTFLRSAPVQVHESSTGADPSVEVKLEPLWRRSTLVDLAKDQPSL